MAVFSLDRRIIKPDEWPWGFTLKDFGPEGDPWASPKMTADDRPSPYVVSASSMYSTTYAGWKIMDQASGAWTSTPYGVVGAWVKLYIGSGAKPVCVREMSLQHYNLTQGMIDFKLQGSNDDSSWTTLLEETMVNNTVAQTFDVSTNKTFFQYYRLLCVTGNDAELVKEKEWTMTGIRQK